MKKHKLYKPSNITKEEQKYINAQMRRELIMTIAVIVMGIAVLVGIIALTKQAASL